MKQAVAAVSALFALASPASAEPPRVRLAVDPCIADGEALRRLVTLELGATVIVDVVAAPDEARLTRIEVRCERESVSIEVTDPASDKHLSRRLSLVDQPVSVRSRLLALAIAELVVAGWVELDRDVDDVSVRVLDPLPVRRARRDAAATVLRRAALLPTLDAARPRWLVSAVATTRLFSTDLGLRGAGLSLGRSISHRMTLALDTVIEGGELTRGLGAVSVRSVSIAPTISGQVAIDRLAFEATIGARVGFTRMSGMSASDARIPVIGHSMSAPWGGPLAALAVRIRPTRNLAVGVGVEVGAVMFAAEGRTGDTSTVAFDGTWLALGASFGAAL